MQIVEAGDLAGGVSLEREDCVFARHADAIIDDADQVRAGAFPTDEYSFGNVKKTESPGPKSGLSLVHDVRTAYGPKG